MADSFLGADTLLRLVNAGRYEEALGVPIGHGSPDDIEDAIFRLKTKYRNDIESVKVLNGAEIKLGNESEEARRSRIRTVGVQLANDHHPKEAIPYLKHIWKVAPTADSAFELFLAHNNADEAAQAELLLSEARQRKSKLSEPYRKILSQIEEAARNRPRTYPDARAYSIPEYSIRVPSQAIPQSRPEDDVVSNAVGFFGSVPRWLAYMLLILIGIFLLLVPAIFLLSGAK